MVQLYKKEKKKMGRERVSENMIVRREGEEVARDVKGGLRGSRE